MGRRLQSLPRIGLGNAYDDECYDIYIYIDIF